MVRSRSTVAVGQVHSKLTMGEKCGKDLILYHSIFLFNHQRSIEYVDNLLDNFGINALSGLQLIQRFQHVRVHQWIPQTQAQVCSPSKDVSFARLSHEAKFDHEFVDIDGLMRSLGVAWVSWVS